MIRNIFVLALLAPLTSLGAQTSALSWMTGCWERRTQNGLVAEQWGQPRGRMMLGAGQTIRGDSTLEYEQVRIADRGTAVVYYAQPSGQQPAEFVAESVSDTLVIFENPAHDFPQRVIYRKRGADSLIARVEGMRGGQLRGVNFPYGRVACVATPAKTP